MPKTSKRVYELVARALHGALQRWGHEAAPADTVIRDVAKVLAEAFASEGRDPGFSAGRFLGLVESGHDRP